MNGRRFESEDSVAVLAEIRRMARTSGRLRTTSLSKLETKLGLPRAAMDEAIRDLYRAGMLSYQADGRELPGSGFISVVLELVEPLRHETAWKLALEDVGFGQMAVANLSSLNPYLHDMTDADIAVLASGLKRLCEDGVDATNDAGFNISARHLMGGSKVLSLLSRRMLDAIGLPLRLQNASPKYVVCAGPPAPTATLLIENPRAFENAVRSGLAHEVALICTFGFGLSYLGQEWLHSDETPEHDKPILIVRQGTPPALNQLLLAPAVYLWADLDLAAIDIFNTLRSAIPQLQMSKIYEAMVPLLKDPFLSHPYATIFGKAGQLRSCNVHRPGSDDQSVPSMLRALCQNRAVDQEAVPDHLVRNLGAFPCSGSLLF